MNLINLTEHAHRVHALMLRAKQTTPTTPTMPDEKTRLLRAKLIMEEALETVKALGVAVRVGAKDDPRAYFFDSMLGLELIRHGEPDLVGIVDGCADVSVVTIGTLLACGVEDKPVLEAVDTNNLGKFGPGHSYREDGKLIKPPGHLPPDIDACLRLQGWRKP